MENTIPSKLQSWAIHALDGEAKQFIFKGKGRYLFEFELAHPPKASVEAAVTYYIFSVKQDINGMLIPYFIKLKRGTAVFRALVQLLAEGASRIVFVVGRTPEGATGLKCEAYDGKPLEAAAASNDEEEMLDPENDIETRG